jgi:hypothetical protein
MSVLNTLVLILCAIVIVVLICLKSYVQYRNNAVVLPITTSNRVVDNNFQEEKISDNDFYRVNV